MKTNRFEMFNFYSTSFESNHFHFQIYRRESEDRYRILKIGEIGNVRELTWIEFDSFFKLSAIHKSMLIDAREPRYTRDNSV